MEQAQKLDDREWLAQQYRTRSANEIADELGVYGKRVLAALHRHGIPIRTKVQQNAKCSQSLLLRNRKLRSPLGDKQT